MILYRHKETGDAYKFLAYGIDCTNSRHGLSTAIYCTDDNEHTIFIKEIEEFYKEFELV